MKNILFILLIVTCISCSGGIKGPGEFIVCDVTIKYHTSNNCDDSTKEANFSDFSYNNSASSIIEQIEGVLSEAEIGECVLVDLKGVFSDNQGEPAGEVYILYDENKSWLTVGENCK